MIESYEKSAGSNLQYNKKRVRVARMQLLDHGKKIA